jgi:hypothetical protein
MKIQLYYSYLPASQLFKESMDILMSPEPSTSTQNHEVSTANLQVVAACSMWLSVNTGSQSCWYWVDSVDIVFVGCCEYEFLITIMLINAIWMIEEWKYLP